MLSLGKIIVTPDAGEYYLRRIAQGREDYYSGNGEAPGSWMGTTAQRMGLAGQVEAEAFLRLVAGRAPTDGGVLRELRDGQVAALDMTFKAPKSVALLYGITEEETSRQVRDAHDAAVVEAVGYLEREACVVRRGKGGVIRHPAEGFLAAAFRHRSSRNGDPLLHTHVVAANHSRGPDGRTTALFTQELYHHARTAGFLYQSALRAELTERLGVRWQQPHNGYADLAGVERRVIEDFSSRRREILESMRERGEHSARAAQIAALDTRRTAHSSRALTLERGSLREQWRELGLQCGICPDDLEALLHQTGPIPRDEHELEHEARRLLGPDGLTHSASTFDRLAVLRALAEGARSGEHVDDLEARATAFLSRRDVVEIAEGWWSTRELVQLEQDLVTIAATRSDDLGGTANEATLAPALRARPSMTDEQVELVRAITRRPGLVHVIRAPAGTGKTYALDAARDAWDGSQIPILGCALSARAACELRDQAAVPSTTIARLRYALDRGTQLQPGTALVVDEAGMVGTRELHALTQAVARANGRIVLVGDDRQLPEIQAGGAFRALADQQPAIELTQTRRQREPWDREALTHLRDGDLEQFARSYLRRGRIVMTATAADARTALLNDWHHARTEHPGDRVVMLANRRTDVRDLNDRARERLKQDGTLGPDTLATEDRAFAIGDQVLATRNDRRLGLHNGQAGRIAAHANGRLTVQLTDGNAIEIPETYVKDGHLDHGYAMTTHKAQGATVDRSFVLGSDEVYREWGYTALSRHTSDTRYYLSSRPRALNDPGPADGATAMNLDDAQRNVVRAFEESRAQHLASTRVVEDPRRREQERLRALQDRAREDVDRALSELERTHWWDRQERATLQQQIQRRTDDIDARRSEIAELDDDLARSPGWSRPDRDPAADPLSDLDLTPELDPGFDLDRGPSRDDGLGLDR